MVSKHQIGVVITAVVCAVPGGFLGYWAMKGDSESIVGLLEAAKAAAQYLPHAIVLFAIAFLLFTYPLGSEVND